MRKFFVTSFFVQQSTKDLTVSTENAADTAVERKTVRGVTIDGKTSRDLDDAIWLSRNGDGWTLDVSIADVGSAILRGSEYDIRAHKMGSTRYFADGNDPMFPRYLSEDKLSLWEGKKRDTVTISIPLSKELEPGKPTLAFTELVSEGKLTYDLVDAIVNQPAGDEIHRMLVDLNGLAQTLLEKRRQNGALAIYDIFSGWVTTEEGFLKKLVPEDCHLANIIVQECMILANQAVAGFFAERDIPVLFRNHTAKAIGSNRAEIVGDLGNSMLHPDKFNIETLQARISLVMNRATYGPELRGHFGLNLPAYLHFTSPIRRYADLVNHRILAAVLAGSEMPYTKEELVELGKHLTAIEQEMKDKRGKSFKDADQKRITQKIDTGRFNRLDADEMHKAIKMAVRSGQMFDEFEQEILKRTLNEQILPRDAYFVLLEASQADPAWIRLKKGVFEWLAKHQDHAVTVFALATQEKTAAMMPEYGLVASGPDHALMFKGTAKVRFREKEYVSEQCVGSSKKHGQQLTCMSLIKRILEDQGIEISWSPTVLAEPLAQTPSQQVQAPAAEGNAKNRLLELCQSEKLATPVFTVTPEGPDHMRTFKAVASIVRAGTTWTSFPCRSGSKKDSEKLAAEDLLKKLGPIGSQDAAKPGQTAGDDANYVSLLQEYLAVRRAVLPSYSSSQSGPAHMPTITCTCTLQFGRNTITGQGQASNSKVAKQRAAREVFEKVLR
ncbi:MAG: ribonuclease [Candidatus Taylorbacteria bacterium]|nr:ribonuclease [Candidatus Taylorbacteria bacterium]